MRSRALSMVEPVGIHISRHHLDEALLGARQVFPGYSSAKRLPTKDSVRAIMKSKRAALRERALNNRSATPGPSDSPPDVQG